MSPALFISHLIGGAVGTTALVLAIMLGTFILEDTTTIIVGVLAADGFVSIPFALFSLYAGIVVGDLALYCLGYLASTNARLARYVDHDFVAPFRAWLETRFVLTVFSARFIPGSRMPTYTASGFFRSPLSTFIATAILATSIWTTVLFSASYWFGSLTSTWAGPARWGIALLAVVALFLIARHNLASFKAAQQNASTADDTRTTSE